MNKKRIFLQITLFLLFAVILSIGDSLCFKAGVGVVPYEAIALTLNYLTGIEVGTLSFFVNAAMILLQLILKQKLDVGLVLQIPLIMVISTTINWMIYYFLSWVPSIYMVRVVVMIIGLLISALGVGLLVALNLVVMPCEGVAAVYSESKKKDFKKIRHRMDILFLFFCVVMSLILKLPLAVREGTVIAAIIYAPVMGVVIKKVKPLLDNAI